jgi:hypothetical protein
METKKNGKEKKVERILNELPSAKRAFGFKLPHGNPTITAEDKSSAKLPTSLVPVFEKIEAKGKDGIKLEALRAIESLGASRHVQWKVRILGKMGYVKVTAETKEVKVKVTKTHSIKKAVEKSTKKSATANNKLAKVA